VVRGIELFYEESGHGETLVLLHNGLSCTKSFAQQVPEFSRHFKVVAYDRYGYGESTHMTNLRKDWLDASVDDLRALLDCLGVEKAHLCGICAGGAIALQFAAKNPQRTNRVAVAGTCCYGEEDMSQKAPRFYPPPDQVTEGFAHELARCHGEDYWRDLYLVFQQAMKEENGYPFKGYDLRPILPDVKSPVIVIYGDRDNLFDVEQALVMHKHLQDSDLCVIPNCGHLPNEERPDDFNRETLRFLLRE